MLIDEVQPEHDKKERIRDRFDYAANRSQGEGRTIGADTGWPSVDAYRRVTIPVTPVHDFPGAALHAFGRSIEHCIDLIDDGAPARPGQMPNGAAVARQMLQLSDFQNAADRRRTQLRARAVEDGYDADIFAELDGDGEEIAIVAGLIATWFGKSRARSPTGFVARGDRTLQPVVERALAMEASAAAHLADLHRGLKLAKLPSFAATELLYMAGEGNSHPKHIAYFLPSDQGVAKSPFKRTYYFGNTHRAMIAHAALPLALDHLAIAGIAAEAEASAEIGLLGVLAHEMGHMVWREAGGYAALNRRDRWISVALQELAADTFGTIILAETLAPQFGIPLERVIAYHLGECLRYLDRGLGLFPDSDGMFLQLQYLTHFGALTPMADDASRLSGEADVVLAGFRSLGRVLADTLLAGETDRAVRLFENFGPPAGFGELDALVAARVERLPISIEYRFGS